MTTYRPTECYAVPGKTMIDTINSDTGLTHCFGRTLDSVRAEYPQAERMTIDAYCESKAQAQRTPITWQPITEERYDYLLGCVPPIAWNHAGFLVGEPTDHDALTGEPRYEACCRCGDSYTVSSRPITVREWRQLTT